MTREEAIRTLITIDGGLSPNFVANGHIAMGMAIKALEQTDEINIGDEVIYHGGGTHDGSKGVVIGACDNWREVRFLSSWSAVGVHVDTLTKTGRYFPQIAEVLEQMEVQA